VIFDTQFIQTKYITTTRSCARSRVQLLSRSVKDTHHLIQSIGRENSERCIDAYKSCPYCRIRDHHLTRSFKLFYKKSNLLHRTISGQSGVGKRWDRQITTTTARLTPIACKMPIRLPNIAAVAPRFLQLCQGINYILSAIRYLRSIPECL